MLYYTVTTDELSIYFEQRDGASILYKNSDIKRAKTAIYLPTAYEDQTRDIVEEIVDKLVETELITSSLLYIKSDGGEMQYMDWATIVGLYIKNHMQRHSDPDRSEPLFIYVEYPEAVNDILYALVTLYAEQDISNLTNHLNIGVIKKYNEDEYDAFRLDAGKFKVMQKILGNYDITIKFYINDSQPDDDKESISVRQLDGGQGPSLLMVIMMTAVVCYVMLKFFSKDKEDAIEKFDYKAIKDEEPNIVINDIEDAEM